MKVKQDKFSEGDKVHVLEEVKIIRGLEIIHVRPEDELVVIGCNGRGEVVARFADCAHTPALHDAFFGRFYLLEGNVVKVGAEEFKAGGRISYNDNRPGHQNIGATVLAVDAGGMTVQFDDRADTTRISFSEPQWMDFIRKDDTKKLEQIAKIFGCSEAQVSAQFVRNYNQLRGMYEQACRTHRKVNGYTSEQLRQLLNSLPMQ